MGITVVGIITPCAASSWPTMPLLCKAVKPSTSHPTDGSREASRAVYRPMPPGAGWRSCSRFMATRTLTILYVQPVAESGGSDRALISLLHTLPEHVRAHVVVPKTHPLAPEFHELGAILHVIPMRRITTSGGVGWWLAYAATWPLTVLRLAWLIRRTKADLVHTNSLHSWYGWAAALLARRPHVWHAREVVTQSGLALKLERFLTRRFARVTYAISRTVAAQFEGNEVEIVLDDVDRQMFSSANAGSARRRLGIDDDVPLAVMVSRVDTWKGLELALAAWPMVRDKNPRAELVMAGGPVSGKQDFFDSLRATASELPGVRWLGPQAEIATLFADADVALALSTTPEPWGLSMLEALVSGTPVIATAHGGHVEISERARGVVLINANPPKPEELANAILECLSRPTSSELRLARTALAGPLPDPAWASRYEQVLNRT